MLVPEGAGADCVEGEAAEAGAPWCKHKCCIFSSWSEFTRLDIHNVFFLFRDLILFIYTTRIFFISKNNQSIIIIFIVSLTFHFFYKWCPCGIMQGWGSDIFSTDPDPAQLKKFRIRILLRIRPEMEMKKKIYLYFR